MIDIQDILKDNDYHRKDATIKVYLNDDKGHYTHEFSF